MDYFKFRKSLLSALSVLIKEYKADTWDRKIVYRKTRVTKAERIRGVEVQVSEDALFASETIKVSATCCESLSWYCTDQGL